MSFRRRVAPLLVASATTVAAFLPGVATRPVAAAEYEFETDAAYDVLPEDGRIDVTVDVAFTNTTPDPDGRFSVFEEVLFAVQDGATAVTASDEEGELDVSVEDDDGVTVATVELRDELRYEDTATFDLRYELADSSDPRMRVRPSVVVFPAWGFGTASEVRVTIPAGYEIRVDGDPMTEDGGSLVSGPIPDPSRWLALVTAVQPSEFTNYDATVPLDGGTADLRVRAFADDEPWGERTLGLVTDALPLIEEAVGLPYPRIGQLVLTESVTADVSGFGEQPSGGNELLIAFDQPPFTALHQVSHVWLSPELIETRWLREGLATSVAAEVAAQLDVDVPFDPAEQVVERADAAFPLDGWSADAGPDGEAYGYAASWAFIDALEEEVGADAVRTVLARVAAGMGPYQASDVEPTPLPDGVAAPPVPLTTRSFLDHLETVSGQDLAERFASQVLSEADVALLPARAEARAAFAELVLAAESWGAPDPVLGAMAAWQFPDATAQIEEAATWLAERDALLDEMQDVGLSAPDRLQQAYRSYGGGPEAIAELEAERAVVEAYAATAEEVNAERSFLERVGLIGGADPEAELSVANGRFADGDLRGSIEAISEAQRITASAETGGIVRIVSAILLIVLVLAVAVLLVRRRTAYTAPR
jgi:hypothetical protein